MKPTPPTLAVSELSRSFGSKRVVDEVSFSLSPCETLCIFGANGAGKTTLLRLLAGLLRPAAGEIFLSGASFAGQREMRSRIGVISHRTMLYDALSAEENVEFVARLYGVRDPGAAARSVLSRMDVGRASTPVRLLSRGMQQRVSIARAIVHEPTLILADEPHTGLDVSGSEALTALLAQLTGQGSAMVMVTHNQAEGFAVASQLAVMAEGRFVRSQVKAETNPVHFAEEYRSTIQNNG